MLTWAPLPRDRAELPLALADVPKATLFSPPTAATFAVASPTVTVPLSSPVTAPLPKAMPPVAVSLTWAPVPTAVALLAPLTMAPLPMAVLPAMAAVVLPS